MSSSSAVSGMQEPPPGNVVRPCRHRYAGAMDPLYLDELRVGQRFTGDTLQVECEVLEITPSRSRPDRGTVVVRCLTRNQKGETVQSFTPKLVVPRRPA